MNIKLLNLHDLKPGIPMPESDEIHIWIVSSETMGNMHKNIQEYSHFLLLKMLSLYTGIPSGQLEFETGKHGKPFLKKHTKTDRNNPASFSANVPRLHFNLSHSGNYAAFAFSSSVPVGIDIEPVSRKANTERIASRMFLPSEAAMLKTLTGEDKKIHFFKLWTRTEAFLKGLGTGLTASFTDEKIQLEYTRWAITYPDAPDGYICCMAYYNP